MLEMLQLPFMLNALAVCLLMSVVLTYFGVHVVSRCIVFIDLALAQISSVGVAYALFTGGDPALYSAAFTMMGAFLFSALDFKNSRVPQEALIGIVYAVASALAILILSKAPHADSDVTAILFGNILAVMPGQLQAMAIAFILIVLLGLVAHKKFMSVSIPSHEPNQTLQKPRLLGFWNLLFYLSLALVISYAIRAAGVLLVFSYLTVPAVSALFLFRKTAWVLLFSILLAGLTSFIGLYVSYAYDFPPGASIVACFGGTLLMAIMARPLAQRFAG